MRSVNEYLVLYDYGTGGLWAVLHAQAENKILEKFPNLKIFYDKPVWMNNDEYLKIASETGFSINSIPKEHWLWKTNTDLLLR